LESVVKYFIMLFIRLYRFSYKKITEIFGRIYLFANKIKYQRPIFIFGIPIIAISQGGVLNIGKNFVMVNSAISNLIGRSQKCSFYVGENAILKIGDNVGMSATSIVCMQRVTIGNNVRLGGNTVIYDTDFHSLVREQRVNEKLDRANVKNAPVVIEDGVFVGAHTTILKGVTIGEDSIIGACSVVTKSIPKNEIWGGNPAKFIRKLDQ
jgi:acetyltransferase-like isoleucine patch superfamily enzyme